MASRKVLGGFLGVAMALILASAIAIPIYLRRYMADGGNPVTQAMRTIVRAASSYRSTHSKGFPPSLQALGGSTGQPPSCQHAQMIDHHLASGFKAGYRFIYSPLYDARSKLDKHSSEIAKANGCATFGPPAFSVNANPEDVSKRGQLYYYTDDTGVLRREIDKLALGNSPKLDGED